MALVATSAVISSVSGRVGSLVFAKAPGGAVVKKAPGSFHSPTPAQVNRRSQLRPIVSLWRTCPDDLRAMWSNLASQILVTNRVGASAPMKPYHLFVRENMYLVISGQSPTITPPINFRSGTNYPTFISITPGVAYWASYQPDNQQPNGRLLCYGSCSNSRATFGPTIWKFFGYFTITGLTTFDWRSAWLTVLPELYTGIKFRLRLVFLPYYGLSVAPMEFSFTA